MVLAMSNPITYPYLGAGFQFFSVSNQVRRLGSERYCRDGGVAAVGDDACLSAASPSCHLAHFFGWGGGRVMYG